jgi:hypothetical protein
MECAPETSSTGVKQLGREADNSHPSGALLHTSSRRSEQFTEYNNNYLLNPIFYSDIRKT